MDGKMTIDARLDAHLKMMELFAGDEGLKSAVKAAADAIEACFRAGGKVYFCGNGGSAADAQHLAAEFSGKFYIDREVLPAEALHCNTSYMTAVANDYSYDIVYSRLISGVGRKGDILVGISTSGNSGNILKAFEVCRQKGIKTIGLLGGRECKLKGLCDIAICVPEMETYKIQELHLPVYHALCMAVENEFFLN
jgi:D-sedoheptulose 7-phosphate isomerase